MRDPAGRILLFAKAPVPGRVKTRLIPALGRNGAAELYRWLLHGSVRELSAARLAPLELWCAPDIRHPFLRDLARRYRVRLRSQGAGDLGRRMQRALADALGRANRAVLLGSDCPSLGPAQVALALRDLVEVDAVFAPVADGGYCLVGLRRERPELFRAMPWSSAAVMSATRTRLRRSRVRWRERPVGHDLDTPADLRRLGYGRPRPRRGSRRYR